MPLLEAVPNLSQGQNPHVLQLLQNKLLGHPHVQLLHIDSNETANRTVFTLIGKPEPLCDALFDFISQATRLIDMRLHHGAHPRIGAVDVCPLVPLQDISLAQSAQLARQLGRRVGQELQIPVYLYEEAAYAEQRKNLAFLRRGEYESLPQKLRSLPPDFGPDQWTENVQKTGACIIGARPFLIAFNINLNTQDVTIAKKIAAQLRQSGGGLMGVKAIGWYMENFGCAQVSCNITDFHAAPLYKVYETCRQLARTYATEATGCELVGLVPLEAMLATGRYYAPQEKNLQCQVAIAAQKLNLSEVKPFNPCQQILEIKAGLTDK